MSVIQEKKIVVKGNPMQKKDDANSLTPEQRQSLQDMRAKDLPDYQNPQPDPTKPTILYVVTKANWGGAQKYVFDLATHFRRDYNIAVAFGKNEFTGKNIFREKMEELGVAIYPIDHMGKRVVLGDDITAAFEIFKILRKVKPQVLHLNSPKAAGLGGLVGRILGVPKIVYTIHGLTSFQDMKGYERMIIDFFTRMTCMFAHRIITISKLEESYVNKWGSGISTKNRLIHHGIHPIAYTDALEKLNAVASEAPATTKDLMGHADSVIVGSIGELTANKGYFFLLEALAEIIKEHPHVVFVHYGTGDQDKLLKHEVTRLGISDHVIFKGFDKLASSYMNMFDIFVLPSVKEGLPYVLLEAAGAARPVIATHVGGIPEIISDTETGLLVPPKDINALTEAITQMINNPEERKSYGHKLKESVSTTFSLENMYQKTAGVYNTQNER